MLNQCKKNENIATENRSGSPIPPPIPQEQLGSGSLSRKTILQTLWVISALLCVSVTALYFSNKYSNKTKHSASSGSSTTSQDTQSSTESSSHSRNSDWFSSGPSKQERDHDANIVCRAYAAQANAVDAFNRFVRLCNATGNYYADCTQWQADSYRSQVERMKDHFSAQEAAYYHKYGETFSARYSCN